MKKTLFGLILGVLLGALPAHATDIPYDQLSTRHGGSDNTLLVTASDLGLGSGTAQIDQYGHFVVTLYATPSVGTDGSWCPSSLKYSDILPDYEFIETGAMYPNNQYFLRTPVVSPTGLIPNNSSLPTWSLSGWHRENRGTLPGDWGCNGSNYTVFFDEMLVDTTNTDVMQQFKDLFAYNYLVGSVTLDLGTITGASWGTNVCSQGSTNGCNWVDIIVPARRISDSAVVFFEWEIAVETVTSQGGGDGKVTAVKQSPWSTIKALYR